MDYDPWEEGFQARWTSQRFLDSFSFLGRLKSVLLLLLLPSCPAIQLLILAVRIPSAVHGFFSSSRPEARPTNQRRPAPTAPPDRNPDSNFIPFSPFSF